MNRISIFCPHCREYGVLQECYGGEDIATHYMTTCCKRWLLNGNKDKVSNQDGLIRVLKQGSWKVSGIAWVSKLGLINDL